jgi:two-component system response regulator FixJ
MNVERDVPPEGAGATILLVEDDDSMRVALERQLNGSGYRCRSFASAESLLADAIEADAACIVSDQGLPGMSGLELLAELRVRGAFLPMILITGHDSVRLRNDAARRRVAGYLVKPFSRAALLSIIKGPQVPPEVER